MENRINFELFKSNVCHMVKNMGDKDFIEYLISKDEINKYLNKKYYAECLYLLGMLDYLCRENKIDFYTKYDALRKKRLNEIVFPSSILMLSLLQESEEAKERSLKEAIPEFLRFNIVEAEIRNVC